MPALATANSADKEQHKQSARETSENELFICRRSGPHKCEGSPVETGDGSPAGFCQDPHRAHRPEWPSVIVLTANDMQNVTKRHRHQLCKKGGSKNGPDMILLL